MYQYECHIFEVLCLSSRLAPTCAQNPKSMTPQIALEIRGEIGPYMVLRMAATHTFFYQCCRKATYMASAHDLVA